jgi:hypothetical protein
MRIQGPGDTTWLFDVLAVGFEMFRENAFTLLLAPLLVGIPAIALINHLLEGRLKRTHFPLLISLSQTWD